MKVSSIFLILIGSWSGIIITLVETKKPCKILLNKIKAEASESGQHAPMPQISCLLCSQPLCFFENKDCEYKSGLPGIPLYENILEFGLVADHIPNDTEVFVYHTKKCNIYIHIFKVVEKRVRITYSECVTGMDAPDCSSFTRAFNDIVLNAVDRCVQIGMIFREKNKIYYSYSSSCKYTPTVYFKESEFISYHKKECFFNAKVDNPKVFFRFHQGEMRESDGVPLSLPCTPGGYVVEPSTGKFFVGTNCLKNFGDEGLESPYNGLNFVLRNVYDNQEDLLFPSKPPSTYEISPTPIYIKTDGRVASRAEMAPEIVSLGLGQRNTRVNCFLKEVKGAIPHCQALLFAKKNEEKWKKDKQYRKYAPLYSCFLCANPECDYYQRACEKYAKTKPIPVYNNLIEFGLFSDGFPTLIDLKISLNEFCNLKVEIRPVFFSGFMNVYVYECLFSDRNCLIVYLRLHRNFKISKECLFFGLGFYEFKYISIGFSLSCLTVPSATISNKSGSLITIRQESCYFDTSKETMFVEYRFLQDKTRILDGVPVILPCSSGGYVVDPNSGRFLKGERCESLFWKDEHKESLEFVIKNIYKNNEDLLFPVDSLNPFKNRVPFYIDSDGEPVPAESRKPIVKLISKSQPFREKCSIRISGVERSRYNRMALPKETTSSWPSGDTSTMVNGSKAKRHFETLSEEELLKLENEVLLGDSSTTEIADTTVALYILARLIIEIKLLGLS